MAKESARGPFAVRCFVVLAALFFHGIAAFAEEPAKVTLKLENADIQELVRWAAQITDKTIIIHPNVQGRITVLAGEPLGRDEAYEVFLSALQVNGFTLIESADTLKIIPIGEAKQGDVPIVDNTVALKYRENIVVRVIKLQNVSAAEVSNLIRPIASSYALIAPYTPTNALIVADREAKVRQLEQIISNIDTAGELEVEMIELSFAHAQDVMNTVRNLLNESGSRSREGSKFSLSVDPRTNSLLMTGDALTRDQIRSLARQLDQPVRGEGNTHVIPLQYANALQLVPILETVSGSIQRGEKDQRLSDVEVKITAHEPLNSLVITAPPSVMDTIRSVIANLDARRAQVLVEAIIVEVNEDLARDLGVRWQTSLDLPNAIFGGISALPAGAPDAISVTGGIPSFGTGLSVGYFKAGQLRALLRALEGESQANILSTPSIVALDNEEAEILVGSNVPFITGSQQRAGDIEPFQTIQRQDIGVSLKIKPHVNNNNSVTLEIQQKVESIGQTDARTADIITNKRELKTRVLIENDDVLVLGGLIRDEVTQSETKVPFFGDIPILGHAFKSTSNATVKQNLMVFIHPVVLPDRDSGNFATRKRYKSIQDDQKAFRDRVHRYLLPRSLPVLPELSAASEGTAPVAEPAKPADAEPDAKAATRTFTPGPRKTR